MFGIEDVILKVDYEGCEYELFKTVTNDTLSKYNQIVVEYHHGYKELIKRLENANFRVKHSIPIHMRNNKRGLVLGYIYA